MDREIACVFSITSVALMPKLTRCKRLAPASDYSRQRDAPSAQGCKLGCGPYRHQQHTSSWASTNKKPDIEPIVLRKPKRIEKGDPLQDEEQLLRGLPIVEPGEEETSNTIKKVPSDQALMPLRWGSCRRSTGRSKSGLQVRLHLRGIPSQPIPQLEPWDMFPECHAHVPYLVAPSSSQRRAINSKT